MTPHKTRPQSRGLSLAHGKIVRRLETRVPMQTRGLWSTRSSCSIGSGARSAWVRTLFSLARLRIWCLVPLGFGSNSIGSWFRLVSVTVSAWFGFGSLGFGSAPTEVVVGPTFHQARSPGKNLSTRSLRWLCQARSRLASRRCTVTLCRVDRRIASNWHTSLSWSQGRGGKKLCLWFSRKLPADEFDTACVFENN